MAGNPPSYSGSDAFGNPTGQPVYDLNGTGRYAPNPLAHVNALSPYSMHGGQIPAPVYQRATAPTSSSPPAVPGLPQRPPFNAPTLSKDEMGSRQRAQDSKAQSSDRPSQDRADGGRVARTAPTQVVLRSTAPAEVVLRRLLATI